MIVSEWKLFDGPDPPWFTQPEFFGLAPHIPGNHQLGYGERMALAGAMVAKMCSIYPINTITDLGCGDGSFLRHLHPLGKHMWGYDAGKENISVGRRGGRRRKSGRRKEAPKLNIQVANILEDELTLGDLVTICEVLEHLFDPRSFLRKLSANLIVATSPSAETAEWHYLEHAWAWDLDGFVELFEDSGYTVIEHTECSATRATNFMGNEDYRIPRWQCIAAIRT